MFPHVSVCFRAGPSGSKPSGSKPPTGVVTTLWIRLATKDLPEDEEKCRAADCFMVIVSLGVSFITFGGLGRGIGRL